MDNENSVSNTDAAGMQFSIAGAVIMAIIYVLQVTETANFPLEPTVTLGIASIAVIGAVLFYTSGKSRQM